jgi:hypothetical protein
MRYLFFHGDVSAQAVRNVESLVLAAIGEGAKELTICIASNGGDVTAGIGLYNFLRMMPIAIDLSPKFPPVLRRVLGLMFGPMRPAFPVPVALRTRWA